MRGRRSKPFVAALAVLAVVLPFQLAPPSGVAAAASSMRARETREVQTIWTAEFSEPHPTGLAYLPGRREILVADVRSGSTSILRMSSFGDSEGRLHLPGLSDPNTLAFDPTRRRLTALSGKQLVTAAAGDLARATPPVSRTDVSALGLRDPQGATFNPASGTWFILDDGSDAIVKASAGAHPAVIGRISLDGIGAGKLRGVAFNPADRLLYVMSPDRDLLYALDRSGSVETTYDMGSLGLKRPTSIMFAPSADATDDPSTQHLFVSDAGTSTSSGAVMEVTLAAAAAVSAPTLTGTLVQTIATSAWNPASPDPSGVEYLPGVDRLIVCDSEVDEVTGAGYHGVNMWQITRTGTVTNTGTTYPAFSKEPTGLGYDPGSNTLFVSDDDAKRIWIDNTGGDGRFGTSDDVVTSINSGNYGSNDSEDPEFDATTSQPTSGHLFFVDGVNTEVYDINPVNGVFGDGNDVMTHFDVGQFGPTDWEGLGSDPTTGNLLVGARATKQIYEVTKGGSLVRIIDLSGITGLRYVSGLQMAPASDGSGRLDYWIVDREIDNGSNSSENDGRLFEVRVPTSDAPPSISITSPASGATVSGIIPVQASASDDHGVAKVEFLDGATSLGVDTNGADGWSISWNTTGVADGAHSLKAVATDTVNQSATSAAVPVTVDNVDNPPTVAITSPPDGSFVKSTSVPIQANASDDKGVTQVRFFADGTSLGTDTNGSDGWSSPVNASFADGPHTVMATATDTASQTASDTNSLTVDTVGPTVSISQPTAGSTVSGTTVTVAATAADANGVKSVQFFAGAASIGTDTNGGDGWSVVWNTTTGSNGSRTLTAVATDQAANTTTSNGVGVTVNNPLVADIRVATSSDDAEERVSKGRMTLTSTDLDMMVDGTLPQSAVGLRFNGINIPRGATVLDAYVQFEANESSSEATTLSIHGQAIDDAPTFTTAKFNVTSRTLTNTSVSWTPPAWVKAERGPAERTPGLTSVIQEIVGPTTNWAAGNAIVLVIAGSGRRVAESFDGARFAPVLHIQWSGA